MKKDKLPYPCLVSSKIEQAMKGLNRWLMALIYLLCQASIAAPNQGDFSQPYTGETLSLNFQDVELRAVLKIIAEFSGFNLIISDTVKGNITF